MQETGLFTEYVDTFLKLKQQASGYPTWANTDALKQRYIQDYSDHENVQLNPANIQHNPGLRTLAKAALNSQWGKMAENPARRQHKILHSPQQFFAYLTDPQKNLADFHVINEHVIQVEYDHDSEFIPESIQTNIYLATFVTSYARLRLYNLLDRLGDRVLYCDTDSVIYISRPGDPELPLGPYLGDLTNELKDPSDYIVEFVCAALKNYAYLTAQGRKQIKIRGFTLNHANSEFLNFNSMKELVLHQYRPENTPLTLPYIDRHTASITVVNPKKICADKRSHKVFNREEKKRYRQVYDKRVINADTLITYPYGY